MSTSGTAPAREKAVIPQVGEANANNTAQIGNPADRSDLQRAAANPDLVAQTQRPPTNLQKQRGDRQPAPTPTRAAEPAAAPLPQTQPPAAAQAPQTAPAAKPDQAADAARAAQAQAELNKRLGAAINKWADAIDKVTAIADRQGEKGKDGQGVVGQVAEGAKEAGEKQRDVQQGEKQARRGLGRLGSLDPRNIGRGIEGIAGGVERATKDRGKRGKEAEVSDLDLTPAQEADLQVATKETIVASRKLGMQSKQDIEAAAQEGRDTSAAVAKFESQANTVEALSQKYVATYRNQRTLAGNQERVAVDIYHEAKQSFDPAGDKPALTPKQQKAEFDRITQERLDSIKFRATSTDVALNEAIATVESLRGNSNIGTTQLNAKEEHAIIHINERYPR